MMDANPIDYVGRNLRGKHVVLLHEDSRYAKLIEFSYLLGALEQERVCVYLTYQEKTLAKKQMMQRGLNVAHFEKKEQLYIIRIYNPQFDFLDSVEQLARRANLTHDFRHCRIVWLFDKRRYDEKQLLSHIEEDSKVHNALRENHCSSFNDSDILSSFDGSILCSYPIDHDYLGHPHILRHHLNNHDSIILAPKHGGGAVLQSNGLRKSDMEAWIRNRLEI